jgi:hypothetical protein
MAFWDDILIMTEEEWIGSEPISVLPTIPSLEWTSKETIKCIDKTKAS